VQIKRPTVVAGGELTLDMLECVRNPATGICEAPLQLKSNGGALVIDDFGRQRISTMELLNRWIIPLEKGHDYLALPSGRHIQVPFAQLLVFSTNLDPRKIVDEAFLRRVPYKIEVFDPTENEFRQLFCRLAENMGFTFRKEIADYLLEKHYRRTGRPLRYCHARDVLLQVKNLCEFHELPKELSEATIDVAVLNYFAGL
jgi:predicted ATPase with chaperone activity